MPDNKNNLFRPSKLCLNDNKEKNINSNISETTDKIIIKLLFIFVRCVL